MGKHILMHGKNDASTMGSVTYEHSLGVPCVQKKVLLVTGKNYLDKIKHE